MQLRQACTALQQEEVNQTIRQLLPSGITFAKARERAVAAVYGEETALLLQKPNNILAIEYLCQLVPALPNSISQMSSAIIPQRSLPFSIAMTFIMERFLTYWLNGVTTGTPEISGMER